MLDKWSHYTYTLIFINLGYGQPLRGEADGEATHYDEGHSNIYMGSINPYATLTKPSYISIDTVKVNFIYNLTSKINCSEFSDHWASNVIFPFVPDMSCILIKAISQGGKGALLVKLIETFGVRIPNLVSYPWSPFCHCTLIIASLWKGNWNIPL